MQGLIEALNAVTEADFEAMQTEINAKRNELASLESLQKVIAVRLGKLPAKAVRESRESKASNFNPPPTDEEQAPPGTTQTEFRRKRIKEYIMANGPTPAPKIAKQTGIPVGSMGGLMKHPMFVATAIGYGLAENHR